MEDNITLPEHEKHSEARFKTLEKEIETLKEKVMSEKHDHDHDHEHDHKHYHSDAPKVNIFSEGDHNMDNAIWASVLPALAAERRGNYGDGFGGGGFGSAAIGAFLGAAISRRGGLFGGEGRDGDNNCVEFALAQKALGEIKADVATSANETQAVVNAVGSTNTMTTLQQTIALQQQLFSGQIAAAQSAAAVKDSVQNTAALNLAATTAVGTQVQTTGCEIKGVVHAEAEATRALVTRQYEDSLNRKLVEQAAELAELRAEGRNQSTRDSIRIEMINNQNQMQQQQQQQGFVINSVFEALRGLTQIAHATNQSIIAGNTGAVVGGPQTATSVNSRN